MVKRQTVNEMRAEMRALVAELDAKCQADVRKHDAKKKPTRATRKVRLLRSEAETKKPDNRLVWVGMRKA